MSLRRLGRTVVVVAGGLGAAVAVVAAAPVLGPVGAVVVAGASIGEALGAAAAVGTVVGGTLVAVSEIDG